MACDMLIDKLLNQLFELLSQANAPIPDVLQPGIDKSTVDRKLKAANINVALPDEVYSLYEWRNGMKSRSGYSYDRLWFFDIGTFPSLEVSILNYEAVAGQDGYWRENMIMLFESGGGEMYLIDCDEKSPTYSMIFIISADRY
jgi:hypothetical protein